MVLHCCYLFPLLPVNIGFVIFNCYLLIVVYVVVSMRRITTTSNWSCNNKLQNYEKLEMSISRRSTKQAICTYTINQPIFESTNRKEKKHRNLHKRIISWSHVAVDLALFNSSFSQLLRFFQNFFYNIFLFLHNCLGICIFSFHSL